MRAIPAAADDQQPFGQAHLVEPVRHRLREDMQVGIFRQVRRQADDPLVLPRQRRQRMAEGGQTVS